ncbi:MAG: DnaJ domain-containing protein [bacterium]
MRVIINQIGGGELLKLIDNIDNKEIFMQGQHVKTDNLEPFFGKIISRDDKGKYVETDSNRYVSSISEMSGALSLTQNQKPILDNIGDYIGGVINIRGDGGCSDSASLLSLLLTCIAENRMEYFKEYLDKLIRESENILDDYDNKGFDITFKGKAVDKNAFKAHIKNLKEKMRVMSIKDFIDEFQNTAVEDLKPDSARLSWIALSRTMALVSAKKTYGDDKEIGFPRFINDNKEALKLDGNKSVGGVLDFCDEEEVAVSKVLMLKEDASFPEYPDEDTIIMKKQKDGSLTFRWGEKEHSVANDDSGYVKSMNENGTDLKDELAQKEYASKGFIQGIIKRCGWTLLSRCSKNINTDAFTTHEKVKEVDENDLRPEQERQDEKNKKEKEKAASALKESLEINKQNTTVFMVSNGAHTNLALTKEFAVSLSEAIQKTDLKNITLANEIIYQQDQKKLEKVNITEFPKDINQDPNSVATIGDMHGNTMKLIWCLIREGVIKMQESDFKEMWALYKNIGFNPKDPDKVDAVSLKKFKDILANKIKVNKGFNVRLLGDILADRGGNDYLTLKVFEKLEQGGVNPEIVHSDHDAFFVGNYEKPVTVKKDAKIIAGNGGNVSVDGVDAENDDGWIFNNVKTQQNSMVGLYSYIKKGLVEQSEVSALYNKYMKPNTNLISYTLHDDKISIYMHAPNNFDVIPNLAKELEINDCDFKSAAGLAKTIDKINKKFRDSYSNQEISEGVMSFTMSGPPKPSLQCMCSRKLPNTDSYPEFVEYIVHGHNTMQEQSKQKCLDNELGKGMWEEANNEGIYNRVIHWSDKISSHIKKINGELESLKEAQIVIGKVKELTHYTGGGFNVVVDRHVKTQEELIKEHAQIEKKTSVVIESSEKFLRDKRTRTNRKYELEKKDINKKFMGIKDKIYQQVSSFVFGEGEKEINRILSETKGIMNAVSSMGIETGVCSKAAKDYKKLGELYDDMLKMKENAYKTDEKDVEEDEHEGEQKRHEGKSGANSLYNDAMRALGDFKSHFDGDGFKNAVLSTLDSRLNDELTEISISEASIKRQKASLSEYKTKKKELEQEVVNLKKANDKAVVAGKSTEIKDTEEKGRIIKEINDELKKDISALEGFYGATKNQLVSINFNKSLLALGSISENFKTAADRAIRAVGNCRASLEKAIENAKETKADIIAFKSLDQSGGANKEIIGDRISALNKKLESEEKELKNLESKYGKVIEDASFLLELFPKDIPKKDDRFNDVRDKKGELEKTKGELEVARAEIGNELKILKSSRKEQVADKKRYDTLNSKQLETLHGDVEKRLKTYGEQKSNVVVKGLKVLATLGFYLLYKHVSNKNKEKLEETQRQLTTANEEKLKVAIAPNQLSWMRNIHNKDYYKVLGVDERASTIDIVKAYRKLAFECHPDKWRIKLNLDENQKEKLMEKFKSISEAYEVLNNPEKRKDYDSSKQIYSDGSLKQIEEDRNEKSIMSL